MDMGRARARCKNRCRNRRKSRRRSRRRHSDGDRDRGRARIFRVPGLFIECFSRSTLDTERD